MTISERMFQIMQEQKMSQTELSRQTGIPLQTINDWRHKKTNPGSDKILILCEVLHIDPKTLLAGEDLDRTEACFSEESSLSVREEQLLSEFRGFSEEKKRRLLAYMNMLQNMKE